MVTKSIFTYICRSTFLKLERAVAAIEDRKDPQAEGVDKALKIVDLLLNMSVDFTVLRESEAVGSIKSLKSRRGLPQEISDKLVELRAKWKNMVSRRDKNTKILIRMHYN